MINLLVTAVWLTGGVALLGLAVRVWNRLGDRGE